LFAISLGSSAKFKLRNSKANEEILKFDVNPGSFYCMKADARHIWEHGVSTNW
jgi:alkylated DNA repair dioxygenase AlkB